MVAAPADLHSAVVQPLIDACLTAGVSLGSRGRSRPFSRGRAAAAWRRQEARPPFTEAPRAASDRCCLSQTTPCVCAGNILLGLRANRIALRKAERQPHGRGRILTLLTLFLLAAHTFLAKQESKSNALVFTKHRLFTPAHRSRRSTLRCCSSSSWTRSCRRSSRCCATT